MPRYFFHLVAPSERIDDELGCEFPDVEQAYLEAHRAALDVGIEMLRNHADPSAHRFEITDANGHILFDLPFAEVMRPRTRPVLPTELHARLEEQKKRKLKITAELQRTVDHTRSLLAETRALLARAAAR